VTIIEKTPPVTDITVLQSIVQFDRYRGQPFRVITWERALKAQPKEEELYRSWFLTAFAAQEWRFAQQVRCSTFVSPIRSLMSH